MGMPGGTQHAGCHGRRYFFVAVPQEQGIFPAALAGGCLRQQDSGLMVEACRLQTHAVQHAAASDGQRIGWNVFIANVFDKFRCRGRDLRVVGHIGITIFLDCHTLSTLGSPCPRGRQRRRSLA